MKAALEKMGVDSGGFSGHSFRIGEATAASQAGVGDATIHLLGRWRSDAYKWYVQPEREELAGVPRQLAAKRGTRKKRREATRSGVAGLV